MHTTANIRVVNIVAAFAFGELLILLISLLKMGVRFNNKTDKQMLARHFFGVSTQLAD